MNQNHVLDISAEVLIGRIFLQGEAKFTAEDMEVAGILLKSGGLPQNVPDVLEQYVGVYSIAGTPAKMTVTRDGATLYIKAGDEQSSGVPLEATAENKFTIGHGTAFEFDVEKDG